MICKPLRCNRRCSIQTTIECMNWHLLNDSGGTWWVGSAHANNDIDLQSKRIVPFVCTGNACMEWHRWGYTAVWHTPLMECLHVTVDNFHTSGSCVNCVIDVSAAQCNYGNCVSLENYSEYSATKCVIKFRFTFQSRLSLLVAVAINQCVVAVTVVYLNFVLKQCSANKRA